MNPLAARLSELSADEVVIALKMSKSPRWIKNTTHFLCRAASKRLAQTLARFDRRVAEVGLNRGAAEALADFGVRWSKSREVPDTGPLLVISNHPGAYDALLLFAAIGRDDVAVLTEDRAFLRALTRLGQHLLPIPNPDEKMSRARGLLKARKHLAAGKVLLHFGAGRIEPDPAFLQTGSTDAYGAWGSGTGALIRATAQAGGLVVVAVVEGVHSPAAKRLFLTRVAEARGLDTVAFLLQVSVPLFNDVEARVRFCAAESPEEIIGLATSDATIAANARHRAIQSLALHRHS